MYLKIRPLNLVLSAIALLAFSCGENPEQGKKEEMKDSTVAITPQTESFDEITYTLPSPVQIASIFKKSGLKYYEGITNVADASKYKASNTLSKALNLGVYSADLSYCILNKQSEQSKTYFKVCRDLAGDLGFAKAFETKNVARRLEKNLSNQDSLSAVLIDIQMETDNILSENKQEHISVISFTGAWIESMFIGVQVHMKEKNTQIASKLVEQMTIAENVIKALKAHNSREAGMPDLIKQMESLNEVYNNFKSIKELKATDPDVIDPSKLVISVAELLSFSNQLSEIRNAIIKG